MDLSEFLTTVFSISEDYYNEYIGACLNGPMLAGTSYTLNFYTAWSSGADSMEFTLYGTPDCIDLPWMGHECPIGNGQWQILAAELVHYTTPGQWELVSLTFTPSVDINAVSIGGPCYDVDPINSNYYYIDELILDNTDNFENTIIDGGLYCDQTLYASTSATGGTWQWYLDGVALVGETVDSVQTLNYGYGHYTAIYTTNQDCRSIEYNVPPPSHTIDFNASANQNTFVASLSDTVLFCINDSIAFTDLSNIPVPDSILSYQWDFGNNTGSVSAAPIVSYDALGNYLVTYTTTTEYGCSFTDSIYIQIIQLSAGITNIVNEDCNGSLNGGATVHNINGPNLGPYIVTWIDPNGSLHAIDTVNQWGNAIQSNLYSGQWSISVSDFYGCPWDTTITIQVGAVEINTNIGHPQCFGTATGSITAFSTIPGNFDFTITDSSGTIVNASGTNTANSLLSGVYYVSITDGNNCFNEIQITLVDPPMLDIELDLVHPLCHGDETGSATVDIVFNAQGDYDQIYYGWDPNPNGTNGLNQTSNMGLGSGEYSLEITDDIGCSRQITFFINSPNPLKAITEVVSPTYCRTSFFQKGNGIVTVTTAGIDSSGTGSVFYHWKNLENGDESDNSTFIVNVPGWMEVTLTDGNNCTYITQIYVDSLNPIADFELESDQFEGPGAYEGTEDMTIQIINQSINFSQPSYLFSDTTFKVNWLANDIENGYWFFSFDYNEKIDTLLKGEREYQVCLVAKNYNDCRDTMCKIVNVHAFPDLVTPNIFTPDAAPNQVFFFPNQGIEILEAKVFNRYGIQVFHFNSINDYWDGNNMSNNKPCADGIYFYTYTAVSTNGTTFEGQGNIHLIREK